MCFAAYNSCFWNAPFKRHVSGRCFSDRQVDHTRSQSTSLLQGNPLQSFTVPQDVVKRLVFLGFFLSSPKKNKNCSRKIPKELMGIITRRSSHQVKKRLQYYWKSHKKEPIYFRSQGESGSPLFFWNHRLNIDYMIWYSCSYRTPSEQHNTIWLGLMYEGDYNTLILSGFFTAL